MACDITAKIVAIIDGTGTISAQPGAPGGAVPLNFTIPTQTLTMFDNLNVNPGGGFHQAGAHSVESSKEGPLQKVYQTNIPLINAAWVITIDLTTKLKYEFKFWAGDDCPKPNCVEGLVDTQ